MAHQNIQNQDLNLVLSSDAKPRLKWTPELHQRFVDSVTQLGGPEKATPKSLMRVMGIHGLTLYHLKSHLQKYRLGKIQQSPACSGNMQEEFVDDHRSDITSIDHNDETPNQINESLKIAQALQMQMEVQRKLHEQIEVQRHLQLRIEAQGKYLQSVLRKAQDTLAGYNSSAIEVEAAKAELSHLPAVWFVGRRKRSSKQLLFGRSSDGNGCCLAAAVWSHIRRKRAAVLACAAAEDQAASSCCFARAAAGDQAASSCCLLVQQTEEKQQSSC